MFQSFKHLLFIFTLISLIGGTVFFNIPSINAQNNNTLTNVPNNTNNTPTNEQKTYILIFEHRTIGNIDNSTKIVSSIVGNNIVKIAEEFVEEMSLAPNQQLEEQVNNIIDNGVKGLPCDDTLTTQEGINVTVNCISSGSHVIWDIHAK